MNIMWFSRENLTSAAADKIIPVSVVLDVGAGIHPQQYFVPNVQIIVEPFLPYVEKLQENESGIPRKVYLIGTWDKVMPLLPDKSVDTIFAVDVIEHLTKEAGLTFLKEAERVAKSQIIIFTPLGFYPQTYVENATDRWGMQGGVWQSHLSGWQVEDFENGWEILACKDYHQIDQYDQPLNEPIGAFWAIKTFSSVDVPREKRYYISELDDDFLASYVYKMKGEKLLVYFDNDFLADYTRGRIGESLLSRFNSALLIVHLYKRIKSKLRRLFFSRK